MIDIGLSSRTVTWADLGISNHRQQLDYLANWWDSEVEPWLNDNIKGHHNAHVHGVWFADPKDAMLFKLTWAGRCLSV